MKQTLLIVTLILSVTLIGCNSQNPQGRTAVEGTVTLDGKPLTQGSVEFASLPDVSPAVMTGGTIKDGKFAIKTK